MTTLKKPPNAFQRLWKELLEPIVFAVVITQFIATLVGVDGVSMMPNLRHHERVFVPKYESWLHKAGVGSFKRGDILIFKPPAAAETRTFFNLWSYRPFLIKRLIGLPGDKVRIEKGVVFVNDVALNDNYTASYWQEQGCWDTESPIANQIQSSLKNIVPDQSELTVPAGEYFVMGDNRTENGSEDSRLFGPDSAQRRRGPRRRRDLADHASGKRQVQLRRPERQPRRLRDHQRQERAQLARADAA